MQYNFTLFIVSSSRIASYLVSEVIMVQGTDDTFAVLAKFLGQLKHVHHGSLALLVTPHTDVNSNVDTAETLTVTRREQQDSAYTYAGGQFSKKEVQEYFLQLYYEKNLSRERVRDKCHTPTHPTHPRGLVLS